MPLNSTGLAALPVEECLALLGHAHVGRVVLSINALPAALPVNYRLIGGNIVFRTGSGGKLTAALDRTIVAFEIDHIDDTEHTGWSVLVVGKCHTITDADELAALEDANIESWLPEAPNNYVAIRIDHLSGRQLGAPSR